MAYHNKTCIFLIILLGASLVSGISEKLICEDLPVELCAFSVSSTGARCVLEKTTSTYGHVDYECLTSQVSAEDYAEWVETDECVQACGLKRMTVGISSDSFVERGFVKSLCSSSCHNYCPNIVDLFSNLATAEGMPLKQVCNAHQVKVSRREMGEATFASLAPNSRNVLEEDQPALGPTSSPSLFTASPPSFS